MSLDNVRTLLINDNLKEAITSLTEQCSTYSSGIRTKAQLMMAQYNALHARRLEQIDVDNEMTILRSAVLEWLNVLETYTREGEVLSHSSAFVLDEVYPFVDRTGFRQLLKDILHKNGPKIIFVKGKGKSGMTYLENYLSHLGRTNSLYSVVRINVAETLDDVNPYKGVNLIKYISMQLAMNLDLNIDEEYQFKFMRFATKLKERYETEEKVPIIFIHDFHRMEIMPDVNRLIALIADQFRDKYPKVIFIVAGMEHQALPSWHTDLKMRCPEYEMEPVEVAHVKDCLCEIYDQYSAQICQLLGSSISRDDYTEGMITKLITTPPAVDIVAVGQGLKDHLYSLQHP